MHASIISEQPTWIRIDPYAGALDWYYAIRAWWWVPPADVGNGPPNVYALLEDENGQPDYRPEVMAKNGGIAVLTKKRNDAGQAEANFPMTADSNFNPDHNEQGPYSLWLEMGGDVISDIAAGMGLIASRHIQYWFVFQKKKRGILPPPTPPGSDLEEELDKRYITRAEFEAFRQKLGMGIVNLGNTVLQ